MRKEGDKHCGLPLTDTDIFAYMAGRQEERKEADNPLLLLSVTQSHLTLCNPMGCSMPGFPVLHYTRNTDFFFPNKRLKKKKKEFIVLEE